MDQTDRWRFRINNVNRAAVGDVNAEHDTALIGDDSIAAREFADRLDARRPYLIDDCDLVSVNLLSGKQWPIADADCIANSAMRRIQPLQHFDFIMRYIDAWNSLRKSVTTDSDRAQRRKLFEG